MLSLRQGSPRRRAAARALFDLRVFEVLAAYTPVLAGTIPLGLDVPESDLDIICHAPDLSAFARDARDAYAHENGFVLWQTVKAGVHTVVARFMAAGFPFELFAQPLPVTEQRAYRHLVVEARLLRLGGRSARRALRRLRNAGIKTESAFAQVFGLTGDPYLALLDLFDRDDAALVAAVWGSRQTTPP